MLWGKRLLLKTLSKVAKSHIHYGELKINYVAGVESQHSWESREGGPGYLQPSPSQGPLDWSVGIAMTQ